MFFNGDLKKEIMSLIGSRAPIIWIETVEEIKGKDAVKDCIKAMNESIQQKYPERQKILREWKVTNKYDVAKGAEGDPYKIQGDLLQALNEVLEETRNIVAHGLSDQKKAHEIFTDRVYLFLDPHPYMENPLIIRRFRDVFQEIRKQSSNVIILSPVIPQFPEGLDKEIRVVRMGFPKIHEITEMLDSYLKNIPATIEKNIDETVKSKIADSLLGLTSIEIEQALSKTAQSRGKFDAETPYFLGEEKDQIIMKDGILQPIDTKEFTLENVGGLELIIEWLQKRAGAYTPEARLFGLPDPRGILIGGIPGTGKSLLCKVLAHIFGMRLYKLDVGSLFSGHVGASESITRKIIGRAEGMGYFILWIDEVDKAGFKSKGESDGNTSQRVFATILNWLQERKGGCFVAATFNNADQLPPEFMRAGRFDERFFINLPHFEERKQIFTVHIKKRKRDPGKFNLDLLAKSTQGLSGSEIEELIITALYDAFYEGLDLSEKQIIAGIANILPLSKTCADQLKTIQEWGKNKARPASKPAQKIEAESSEYIPLGF